MEENAKKTKTKKFRNWVFILYPESAPNDWMDRLEGLMMPVLISPLHDKDVNPDGSPKKPHYHVLIMFDGPVTASKVMGITVSLNATMAIECKSVKGTARYMLHLDNPEKHRYSESELRALGGIDVSEMLKPTSADRYKLLREMMEFINESGITEFSELVTYAMYKRFDDWFPLLTDSSTVCISAYVNSRRNMLNSGQKERLIKGSNGELIDTSTGAIL